MECHLWYIFYELMLRNTSDISGVEKVSKSVQTYQFFMMKGRVLNVKEVYRRNGRFVCR